MTRSVRASCVIRATKDGFTGTLTTKRGGGGKGIANAIRADTKVEAFKLFFLGERRRKRKDKIFLLRTFASESAVNLAQRDISLSLSSLPFQIRFALLT
mmetsp:Transcript_10120/g.14106  ORF Transcript_10120/g.14106 Transcript_10120/m.14106 type:complete len:99 (+) Transcript_10120:3364-3660(+)